MAELRDDAVASPATPPESTSIQTTQESTGVAPAADTSSATPAVAASSTAGQTQSPSPSWLDSLRQHNLPVGKDEAETIENLRRLHEERQALESLRGYVPHVQEYMKNAPAFAEWRKAQQSQQQAQQPQSQDEPWWKPMWSPPEYSQSWERFIVLNAQGQREWHPSTPPEVRAKYEAYKQYEAEQVQKFTSNPYEYMGPAIEQRARAIAEEVINSRLQRQDQVQTMLQFEKENEGWLYEIDPATKQRRMQMAFDPATGQQTMTPVFSPFGQRYVRYAKEQLARQKQRGYSDLQEAKDVAMAMTQRDAAAWELQQLKGQTPAQSAAADPQKEANKAFLDKMNPPNKNTRTGNMKAADKPLNDRNLFSTMLKDVQANGYN